jgi:hypothetical protein
MEEEIKGRQKNFSCFWRGYDCVPTNYFKGMDGITPTEEACKYDSAIILDMILKANADVSFWKGTQTKIPDSLTYSSLSTSNPILYAIKSRHMEHLQRLLDDGFNPNVMPLVIRQQSYPPIMACFVLCDPPNWDAFSTLLESKTKPEIDRDTVTPLYKIHTIHIVVELQSLPVLERVLAQGFELFKAGPTVLGHTLLHIACLPLDITQINVFEESIYGSAHEFRSLLLHSKFQGHIIFENELPIQQATDFFDAQTELVLFLLFQSEDPYAELAARDCHGNTAFHYLAMYRIVNLKLLKKMMAFAPGKGEALFEQSKNFWDWSAGEVMRRGLVAEVKTKKEFWRCPCAGRYEDDGPKRWGRPRKLVLYT